MDLKSGNIDFGFITIVNGIVATLLGGWIGDRLLKRYFGAYYSFSGIAMLIAVPVMVAAIYVSGSFMFPAIFAAVFFILVGTGPTNAALVNSVSANIRSTALAVNVFVIHLLGDAFSPTLIGKISDQTGSLQVAFWVAFVAAGISGIILLYGAKFAPRLQAAKGMIWFYWISGLLLALIWLVPVVQLALHFSEVADLTQPEWNPPQMLYCHRLPLLCRRAMKKLRLRQRCDRFCNWIIRTMKSLPSMTAPRTRPARSWNALLPNPELRANFA